MLNTEEFSIALGEAIRLRRFELGLHRYELAHRADISPDHPGRIERGKVPEMNLYTLRKIAEALEMGPSALIIEAELISEAER